jgi:hypothetical protein
MKLRIPKVIAEHEQDAAVIDGVLHKSRKKMRVPTTLDYVLLEAMVPFVKHGQQDIFQTVASAIILIYEPDVVRAVELEH